MDFFKVIIQKLSIFKGNSALLVPIVIGLVSVLLLIPTQLMSSKLKKRIESESVSKIGKNIQSLSKEAVSSEQWKKEQERQQDYASDANEISLLVKRSTQRELLSYKMFPEPQDKSQFTFLEFGKRYCAALEALVAGIGARDCPTDAELDRALEGSASRSISDRDSRYRSADSYLLTRSPGRSPGSPYGGRSDVKDTIVDEVCRQRAESAVVYANPADLCGYEFWREYKYESGIQEAVEDCWYYQLAYWITEDVINTIGAMNSKAGSHSVLTSPAKRLIGVYFNLAGVAGGGQALLPGRGAIRGATTGKEERPVYVLSPEEAAVDPYTGRYCNDDIDVIHFNIVVIVSAKAVLPFVQELCSAKEHKFAGFSGDEQERIYKHNQITVLESNINSINRDGQNHSFYRYGDEAVVELDLICEYIFNKAAYEEIKPASVKGKSEPEDKGAKKKKRASQEKVKQNRSQDARDFE
jgi:hypothetical protein